MVAHHGIDAMRCLELTQHGEKRCQLTTPSVHQVAREENQLWIQRIDLLHDAPHHPRLKGKAAQVQVAKLHDAKALKPSGKSRRSIFHLSDHRRHRLHLRDIQHEGSYQYRSVHGHPPSPRISVC